MAGVARRDDKRICKQLYYMDGQLFGMAGKKADGSLKDVCEPTEAELLEIKNPFEKSLGSFERFVNWGLAISVGTLLWFIGNFDKFTTRYVYHIDNTTYLLKSSLPNKYLFISSIVLLSFSAIVFVFFRVKLYYNSYKFDCKRELCNASFKLIFDKLKLAKSHPNKTAELLKNLDVELNVAQERQIEAGAWVGLVNEFIVLEDQTKKYLTMATASYILGLAAAVLFLGLFMSILE